MKTPSNSEAKETRAEAGRIPAAPARIAKPAIIRKTSTTARSGGGFLLGILLWVPPAMAADQLVSNLSDSGPGSLRSACNAVHDGGTITFSVTGVITLTSNEIRINKEVTIIGPGANLLTVERSAAATTPPFRIFHVLNSVVNKLLIDGSATISGLTLRNGAAGLDGGGGILVRIGDSGNPAVPGLTLENCVVSGCSSDGRGGGIKADHARLAIRKCAILGNHAGSDFGGGIGTIASQAVVESSTIYGNMAEDGAAIMIQGGSMGITSCTIVDNRLNHFNTIGASCMTCSTFNGTGSMTVRNNILKAAPNPSNQWTAMKGPGIFVSQGYNICSDGGLGLTGPGDQPATNPFFTTNLTPAGNGGTVPTIELQSSSPAVDKGRSFDLPEDQRDLPRVRDAATVTNAPGGDGTDVGAFELQEFEQNNRFDSITVTTTLDHDDGLAGAVDCTLREAINASVFGYQGKPFTILFAEDVTGVIGLNNTLGPIPAIIRPIRLIGPGARALAISGQLGVRPLLRFSDSDQNHTVASTLSGLTLRNARGVGAAGDGAGLLSEIAPGSGGLIKILDCAFVGNAATTLTGSQPGQAGGDSRGGAVFNRGDMIMERCSFDQNTAVGGGSRGSSSLFISGPAGGGGLGGAIFNDAGASLAAANCSFYNNEGTGGVGALNTGLRSFSGAGGPAGGAIYNLGNLTLTGCTVSGNTGTGGSGGGSAASGAACGGLFSAGGTFRLGNTICAGNTFFNGHPATSATDVRGIFASTGWNLIGRTDGSTGLPGRADRTGTVSAPLNPKLGPFQNNGGAGDSFLLLPGSPALDQGNALGLITDQRNLPRSYDNPSLPDAAKSDSTDMGAVEMQPAYTGNPAFVSVEFMGPVLELELQGAAFTNYRLQESANLLPASFNTLGNPKVTDSIGRITFTVYGPFPGHHFYRAIKVP